MRSLFLACMLAVSGQLIGCAGSSPAPRSAADVASADAQEAAQQERYARQARRMQELQRRLAAAEAENEGLRRSSAPTPLRETIRIGDDSDGFRYFDDDSEGGWDVVGEPELSEREPEETRPSDEEGSRPLLQLYGTPTPEVADIGPVSTATPLRLATSPVPAIPAAMPMMNLNTGYAPAVGAYAPRPVPAPVDRDVLGRDAYGRAVALMRERRLNEAYGAFERFLSSYPEHRFVGSARYWQAEILYLQRRYADALSMYERFVQRHARSQRAPEALLKISLCHQRMGQRGRAQAVLQELVRDYPDSVAAQSLRERSSR